MLLLSTLVASAAAGQCIKSRFVADSYARVTQDGRESQDATGVYLDVTYGKTTTYDAKLTVAGAVHWTADGTAAQDKKHFLSPGGTLSGGKVACAVTVAKNVNNRPVEGKQLLVFLSDPVESVGDCAEWKPVEPYTSFGFHETAKEFVDCPDHSQTTEAPAAAKECRAISRPLSTYEESIDGVAGDLDIVEGTLDDSITMVVNPATKQVIRLEVTMWGEPWWRLLGPVAYSEGPVALKGMRKVRGTGGADDPEDPAYWERQCSWAETLPGSVHFLDKFRLFLPVQNERRCAKAFQSDVGKFGIFNGTTVYPWDDVPVVCPEPEEDVLPPAEEPPEEEDGPTVPPLAWVAVAILGLGAAILAVAVLKSRQQRANEALIGEAQVELAAA